MRSDHSSNSSPRLRLVKLIALALVFFLAVFLVKYLDLDMYLTVMGLREYLSYFGLAAPLMFVLIYALSVPLLFPASVLTIVSGIIFGIIWGTVYTIIGATLGASLAFIFARYMARETVEAFLLRRFSRMMVYKKDFENAGFLGVLAIRLVPAFPFSIMSFILGLSRLRFYDFFFGTLVGSLPGTFVYVYLGESVAMLNIPNIVVSIILLVAFILLAPLAKKYFNHEN